MRTLLLRSLFARAATVRAPSAAEDALDELGRALQARARRLFGRSISIREVDAGSCNGCELEIHALNNAVYDVERFGIRFVASPRHADVLMVTGPVTYNMKIALERTYAATAAPKWVVAVGDCAAGCGLFQPSYAVIGSVDKVIPVDLHIRGCPPQPIALLQGLVALIDQATRRRPRAPRPPLPSGEKTSLGEGKGESLTDGPNGQFGQARPPDRSGSLADQGLSGAS